MNEGASWGDSYVIDSLLVQATRQGHHPHPDQVPDAQILVAQSLLLA
jgi:hypothetical protein